MAMAKELTNHSLPEIGDAFGGRDHTTVLHACRKIAKLRATNADISEDYLKSVAAAEWLVNRLDLKRTHVFPQALNPLDRSLRVTAKKVENK